MAETVTVWVTEGESIPPNADPAAGILGYTIEAQFPHMNEPETRVLSSRDLGPRHDVATTKAVGMSASQMLAVEGNLGILAIWWLAGMQAGEKETFAELEPLFSTAGTDAHVKKAGVQVQLLEEGAEPAEEAEHLGDPS